MEKYIRFEGDYFEKKKHVIFDFKLKKFL